MRATDADLRAALKEFVDRAVVLEPATDSLSVLSAVNQLQKLVKDVLAWVERDVLVAALTARPEAAPMPEKYPCPLCGAERTEFHWLIAQCPVCRRDTFEDKTRPEIPQFGRRVKKARIAAGIPPPKIADGTVMEPASPRPSEAGAALTPFNDTPEGWRAMDELRALIGLVRLAGPQTDFLHSAIDARNLIWRWAVKWTTARPALPATGTDAALLLEDCERAYAAKAAECDELADKLRAATGTAPDDERMRQTLLNTEHNLRTMLTDEQRAQLGIGAGTTVEWAVFKALDELARRMAATGTAPALEELQRAYDDLSAAYHDLLDKHVEPGATVMLNGEPVAATGTGAWQPTKQSSLANEIAAALNRHSAENESNTPDFILAQYLLGCLQAWDNATRERERHYGRSPNEPPAPTTER